MGLCRAELSRVGYIAGGATLYPDQRRLDTNANAETRQFLDQRLAYGELHIRLEQYSISQSRQIDGVKSALGRMDNIITSLQVGGIVFLRSVPRPTIFEKALNCNDLHAIEDIS